MSHKSEQAKQPRQHGQDRSDGGNKAPNGAPGLLDTQAAGSPGPHGQREEPDAGPCGHDHRHHEDQEHSAHKEQEHRHDGHHHPSWGHHHHGHGHHHHGHHHHHDLGRDGNKKGLIIALIITAGILLLEFFGGLITGSLALLSDSGHMLSDAASLALSLGALWFASRPASPAKTYGFYRFEILAALFNGAALFAVSGWIVWEAIERLTAPPEVQSGPMMLIAFVGLAANLLSAWSLMKQGDVHGNLNLRSAYLHILGDALGSVGAIAAGVVMYFFGWYAADPIISMIVALLILKSAWGVLSHSVHILMEGTPRELDQIQVKAALEQIPGVLDVHDLHIWSITSGMDSLSCHLLVQEGEDGQNILQEAIHRLERGFGIRHSTIQVETERIKHSELH